MARKYLAFDIETARIVPEVVSDLHAYRPLGICCAATAASDEQEPRLWHGFADDGSPAAQMSRGEVAELVKFLSDRAQNGYTLVSWNGLAFDFDILAEESGLTDQCQELARSHVDMMFHVFCELGYPISLDRAGQGMRLPGKLDTVPQHLAPQYWAEGRTDEVLQYVAQDARLTLQLALACDQQRRLRWITHKGHPRECRLPRGWLPAERAMELPLPDTSWMSDPIPRSRFTAWLQ